MVPSYEATLVKVIDGDSLRLKVNLGFNLEGTFDFQLQGLDAPEVVGKRSRDGKETKKKLIEMLRGAYGIVVRPNGLQTGAGRWWAYVDVVDIGGDGFCVNAKLLSLGLAAPR